MDSWISDAGQYFGVVLRPHANGEAAGPCPQCGGTDRFVVFDAGNAWCRRCKYKEWWLARSDAQRVRGEIVVARAERETAYRAEMARSTAWAAPSIRLRTDEAPEVERLRDSLRAEGIDDEAQRKWGLGYVDECPLVPGVPALSIPVFHDGRLFDIRYRLLGEGADAHGKYRSHGAGSTPYPYNLDSIYLDRRVVVVEGEKKAIVLASAGIRAVVGIPGSTAWGALLDALDGLDRRHQGVVVAFDPGAEEDAQALAEGLSKRGHPVRVADAWGKPDELVVDHGLQVLVEVLNQAREVVA